MEVVNHISSADQKFLEIYDFDKESSYNPDDDWMLHEITMLYQRAESFLREQSGRSFTTKELIEYVKISRTVGLEFLRNRDDVKATLTKKNGYVERWESHAEPFEPTQAGINEVMRIEAKLRDEMGRGARADYYWTQKRGCSKRRNRLAW